MFRVSRWGPIHGIQDENAGEVQSWETMGADFFDSRAGRHTLAPNRMRGRAAAKGES